jgi:hypothetical protein
MIWLAIIIAVFLLIAFPKQMLAIAALSVVGIGIIYLLMSSADDRRRHERESIVVSVRFDTTVCGPDYPLHVTITNNGTKTVSKVQWRFAAYRSGFSSDLAEYGSASSDKILARGESYSGCYRIPRLTAGSKPEGLQWGAEGKSAEFQGP